MTNKPRILYLLTFPLYGSGSGTYARYLAEYVGKTSEVALFAPDSRKIPNVKMYPFEMPFKVAFTGHPEWPDCKLFDQISNKEFREMYTFFLNKIIEVVEDFKPTLIHVHHAFPLSWCAEFIQATYNIPYVVTIHGSELPTAQKDKRYVPLTQDALRHAHKVVPNSFWTRDWMYKVFGKDSAKQIKVIPGGVDIHKFTKKPTKEIDDKLNLHDKKTVVFAGKLTVHKGVKYLVKAAKYIKGEVLIVGDGPERANLEAIVEQEKLTNVKFLGHSADNLDFLIQCYSRTDVFVAPSTWDEPLGLVILEAMACENPAVVTRKGGIPLAVKDKINGLFIRPRNVKDIVEKVNYLLDNDDRREKMALKARELVEKHFSWETIAERFMKIYESVPGYKTATAVHSNHSLIKKSTILIPKLPNLRIAHLPI